MKAAIYARVSTADQHSDMQVAEMKTYCERRGWVISSEYVDVCSGAKDSRPQLDRLMSDARQRCFDVVLVWKLDRFGRSLRHLLTALGEFEALGVSFASLRDSLDLSTPAGRLMFQVIGAMAEFERSLIRERVKASLQHIKAHGPRPGKKEIGRPRKLVDAAKIIEMRSQGQSWPQIARATGLSVGKVYAAGKSLSKTPAIASETAA